MPRTIRLQSDSNAHDRPWWVAVERGHARRVWAASRFEFQARVSNLTAPRLVRLTSEGCRIVPPQRTNTVGRGRRIEFAMRAAA